MKEIALSNNNTIKSTELVEIINEFRRVESEVNKDKRYVELQHKSFIEKIRKEIDTLNMLGINTEQNILPSKYKDSTGRNLVCFELDRDGMLQMLNSESAYVRRKTIEYINKLESEIKEQNKEVKLQSKYDKAKSELELVGVISDMLRLNDISKLGLMRHSLENNDVPTNLLPDYIGCKENPISATELLKKFAPELRTADFNKKCESAGILKRCERPSTKNKDKVKKYWSIVDTTYGENMKNDHNSRETQPLWYESKFSELLNKI